MPAFLLSRFWLIKATSVGFASSVVRTFCRLRSTGVFTSCCSIPNLGRRLKSEVTTNSKMRSLLLYTLAVGLAGLSMARGDCLTEAQQCLRNLIDAVQHITDNDSACREWKKFIGCMEAGCGEIDQHVLDSAKQTLARAGVHCDGRGSSGSRVMASPVLHVLFAVIGFVMTFV